jgi:mxaC protein
MSALASLSVDRPLVLLLLALYGVPLFLPLLAASPTPWSALTPADAGSRWADATLRALAVTAIAALVLALAGLHRTDQIVERTGVGAHLVLLIDRSSSMDNTFANRRPDGTEEAKSAAAKRLILAFVRSRPRDRMGVATFSTAPMLAVPLTDHLGLVEAALETLDEPGLAQTNVGRGLALAVSMFGRETGSASRAVVLVSDGAGVISREVQAELRDMIAREPVNLYWLFLRSEGSKGLFEPSARGEQDTPQVRPERHLNLFLQTLGVPYRAFEAENPDAVAVAIAEIDRLEARPLTFSERIPRTELRFLACLAALGALLPLIAVKLWEHAPFAARAPLPPLRHRGSGAAAVAARDVLR